METNYLGFYATEYKKLFLSFELLLNPILEIYIEGQKACVLVKRPMLFDSLYNAAHGSHRGEGFE